MIAAGQVHAVVDQRYPPPRCRDCPSMMEAGAHFGKIVLVTNEADVSERL